MVPSVLYFNFSSVFYYLISVTRNWYSRFMVASETFEHVSPNIMSDYFANTGDGFHNYIAGWCGPLTHTVSKWLAQKNIKHKRVLIVRGDDGKYLNPAAKTQPPVVHYHAIIVVNGMVHCPWFDERLAIDAYCAKMFPGQKVIIGENYSRFITKETRQVVSSEVGYYCY